MSTALMPAILMLACFLGFLDASRIHRHRANRGHITTEKSVNQCTIDGPPGSTFSYRFKVHGGCRAKCLGAKVTLHSTIMPTFMRAVPNDRGKSCTCFLRSPRASDDKEDKMFVRFPTHSKSLCTGESCWDTYLRLGNAGKARQNKMSTADAGTMQSSCSVCEGGACAESSGLFFDGLHYDETHIALLKASAEKGDTSAKEQLEILKIVDLGAINQPTNIDFDEEDKQSTVGDVDNEEDVITGAITTEDKETIDEAITTEDDEITDAITTEDDDELTSNEHSQIAPNRMILERDGFCVPAHRSGLIGTGMKAPANKDCTQFKLILNSPMTGTFRDPDSGLCLGYLAKDGERAAMEGEGLNGLIMTMCGVNLELSQYTILQKWFEAGNDQYCVSQHVCVSRRVLK